MPPFASVWAAFARAPATMDQLSPCAAAAAVAAALPPAAPLRVLHNIAYSHGGYMAAAPEMLRNSAWCAELQRLVPHAYARLSEAVSASAGGRGKELSSGRLMALLENNPVLAAFGHGRAAALGPRRGGPLPAVELDIYLDPVVCAAVERAFKERGVGGGEVSGDGVLCALASQLVETTLVAHGGLWHVFLERALGVSVYASIARRCGGMTVARWLVCFRAALSGPAAASARREELETVVVAVPDDRPAVAAAAPLSVFLDVKSSAATPRALLLLVAGLNARGVRVWGVGSFLHRQVTHASWGGEEQRVIGTTGTAEPSPAPIPFRIFSHVAGLQAACEAGRLPRGSHVLFNGGTMLADEAGGGGPGAVAVPAALLRDLRALAVGDLRLGFYAAEQALGAGAADALASAADAHPGLFGHGFAYSGVPRCVAADIPPHATGAPRVPSALAWLLGWMMGTRFRWRYSGEG